MRGLTGRGVMAIAGLLALVGCDDGLSPQEQEQADAEAVAMVEAANAIEPPLVELVPQPLLEADMEATEMGGERCEYAPGTNLGVLVVARQVDAFIKVDDEVVRFAADPGARQLPFETRTIYNGREHSLRLDLENAEKDSAEATSYEGTVTLRDRWDRVVYTGTGPVNCTK